jgi:hypothetical protein
VFYKTSATEPDVVLLDHRRVLADFWSWRLREVPEFASALGIHGYDDRLETFTLEAFRHRKVRCTISRNHVLLMQQKCLLTGGEKNKFPNHLCVITGKH